MPETAVIGKPSLLEQANKHILAQQKQVQKEEDDKKKKQGLGLLSMFEVIFELFAKCFEEGGVFEKFVNSVKGFQDRLGEHDLESGEVKKNQFKDEILKMDRQLPEDFQTRFKQNIRKIEEESDPQLRELWTERLLTDAIQMMLRSDNAKERALGQEWGDMLFDKKLKKAQTDEATVLASMINADTFLENKILDLAVAKNTAGGGTLQDYWTAIEADPKVKAALALPKNDPARQLVERFRPSAANMGNAGNLQTDFLAKVSDEALQLRFNQKLEQARRDNPGITTNSLRDVLVNRAGGYNDAELQYCALTLNKPWAVTLANELNAANDPQGQPWSHSGVLNVARTHATGQVKGAYQMVAELNAFDALLQSPDLYGVSKSQQGFRNRAVDLNALGIRLGEANRRLLNAQIDYQEVRAQYNELKIRRAANDPSVGEETLAVAKKICQDKKDALTKARLDVSEARLSFTPTEIQAFRVKATSEIKETVEKFNQSRQAQIVNMSRDSLTLMNKLIQKRDNIDKEMARLKELHASIRPINDSDKLSKEQEQRKNELLGQILALEKEHDKVKQTIQNMGQKFGALFVKLKPENRAVHGKLLAVVTAIVGKSRDGLGVRADEIMPEFAALSDDVEQQKRVKDAAFRAYQSAGQSNADPVNIFVEALQAMNFEVMGETNVKALDEAQDIHRSMHAMDAQTKPKPAAAAPKRQGLPQFPGFG